MKLYFVRHGESEANRLNEFSNRGHKHGLTQQGRQQALALAARLADIEYVYTSPLLRAVETAKILTNFWHIEYQITDALREFDCGVLEGRSDRKSWLLFLQLWKDWLEHRQWERCIEGGERFTDIQARFVPFIDKLITEYGTTSSSIVLVGHAGTYRCMLPLVLKNIDFDYALNNSITHTGYVLAEQYGEELVCQEWCP